MIKKISRVDAKILVAIGFVVSILAGVICKASIGEVIYMAGTCLVVGLIYNPKNITIMYVTLVVCVQGFVLYFGTHSVEQVISVCCVWFLVCSVYSFKRIGAMHKIKKETKVPIYRSLREEKALCKHFNSAMYYLAVYSVVFLLSEIYTFVMCKNNELFMVNYGYISYEIGMAIIILGALSAIWVDSIEFFVNESLYCMCIVANAVVNNKGFDYTYIVYFAYYAVIVFMCVVGYAKNKDKAVECFKNKNVKKENKE